MATKKKIPSKPVKQPAKKPSQKEAKEAREAKGKIHLLKFEITKLDAETKALFKRTANTLKRIANCHWRTWLNEHSKAGNVYKVQQFLRDLETWYKLPKDQEQKSKKKGGKSTWVRSVPAPKCEVYCFTPEIGSAITSAISANYPEVNHRCVELAIRIMQKTMMEKKSSKGNLKQWMRILADDGEYPNSSSPAPIPFDVRNCEIIVPQTDDEDFQLKISVNRIASPGKKTFSTVHTLRLFTKKRQIASQTKELWKIAAGEYAFCGSNLVFKESKGKWFAHICYRKPPKEIPNLDIGKIAFLHASRKHPWTLRIDGKNRWIGGKGHYIADKREQLLTYRWSHQGAYRYATSARKGHGRTKAIGRLAVLRDAWTNFVDTVTHQATHDVIARCIENGCGRIVYFQPAGDITETRFLYTAGKKTGRIDGTGWDWYKVLTQLKYKAERVGIKVEVKKIGETDPFEKSKVA